MSLAGIFSLQILINLSKTSHNLDSYDLIKVPRFPGGTLKMSANLLHIIQSVKIAIKLSLVSYKGRALNKLFDIWY